MADDLQWVVARAATSLVEIEKATIQLDDPRLHDHRTDAPEHCID
jgi:hypothetical protein